MNSTVKRAIAAMLAVMLIVCSFASCKKDDGDNEITRGANSIAAPETTAAPTEPVTDETTTEPSTAAPTAAPSTQKNNGGTGGGKAEARAVKYLYFSLYEMRTKSPTKAAWGYRLYRL